MSLDILYWIPFLSFISIFLLSLPKFHTKDSYLVRLYSGFLLFPALAAYFFILRLVIINQNNVIFLSRFEQTPLVFGAQLNQLNSFFVLAMIFCCALIVFLMPRFRLIENLVCASLAFASLFVISTFVDQLFGISALSVGSVALIYLGLNNQEDPHKITVFTDQFLLHRLSDFTLIFAVLILLADDHLLVFSMLDRSSAIYHNLASSLYFISSMLRLLCLILETINPSRASCSNNSALVFNKLLMSVGPQILLIQISHLIFTTDNYCIFLSIAIAFLALSIFLILSDQHINNKSILFEHLFTITMSASLVTICAGFNQYAMIIICANLISHPLLSLSSTAKIDIDHRHRAQPAIDLLTTGFLRNLLKIFVRVFSSILSPYYIGFILYRSPQLVIRILQIPLRFFHSGSLQRSILFTTMAVIGYLFWLGA